MEVVSSPKANSTDPSFRGRPVEKELVQVAQETGANVKMYYENSILKNKELEDQVVSLVTRCRQNAELSLQQLVGREEFDEKLSELFKELQRFKAQLLSKSASLEHKKQVLLTTKPFELIIEEVKASFSGFIARLISRMDRPQRKFVHFEQSQMRLIKGKTPLGKSTSHQGLVSKSISK